MLLHLKLFCLFVCLFDLIPSILKVSQLKVSWITFLNLRKKHSIQTGLSLKKWFTECLTLIFTNAKSYIRSWDIMPSTGILFAIYVYCLDLWKNTQLSEVAAVGCQRCLKLLKMAIIAWFSYWHIGEGRLLLQQVMRLSWFLYHLC